MIQSRTEGNRVRGALEISAPPDSYHLQNGRVDISLSEVGTLLGIGGAIKLTLEDLNGSQQKMILLRPEETDYLAFANACTHNGKELDYLHSEGLLACCGRSSRFDLAGDVIQGPAEDALPSYRVWRKGGEPVIEE